MNYCPSILHAINRSGTLAICFIHSIPKTNVVSLFLPEPRLIYPRIDLERKESFPKGRGFCMSHI